MRRVAILYNEPGADADTAELDVLDQVRVVQDALGSGVELSCVGVGLNLAALDKALACRPPDVVFNLVESLGGSDQLSMLVPLLLESRGIPYTGAGAAAQMCLADKVAAKNRLRTGGLPTPDWFVTAQSAHVAPVQFPGPGRYIIKARREHASMGLNDDAILHADTAADLERAIHERTQRFNTGFFAERFITGREFNLALLQRRGGEVQVLPAAEIDFSAFPPDKPRIVGWDAKWQAGSFEYQQTPRRFELPAADAELSAVLADLALRAWKVFGLRGYARVDFRIDEQGKPWILELNFNPCLSPDAGFAAALEAAGIPLDGALHEVLEAAAIDG